MGVTEIGSTNVGLFSHGSAVGEATVVQQTSNISLKGLSTGGEGMTFAADGGPGDEFDKIEALTVIFNLLKQILQHLKQRL